MSVSATYLERCAADTGFQPAVLEKVIRLGMLANEIGRHPLLGKALLLKGGTPLNLGFGSPTRLSVDLDFNYVGAVDRQEMLAERPRIEGALEELAGRLGYRVQRSADAHAGRAYYLSYQRATGGSDRIEVDLNFLFRTPIGTPQLLELWQPGELDRPRVRAVSPEELYIGKLLAMLDRSAPRDAWDVGRLPDIGAETLYSPLFRSQFIAVSMILDHPVDSYDRARLAGRITDRAVTENLWPMLANDMRPQASKLVDDAWSVVGPYTELNQAEETFLRCVERGDFRGGLLELDAASVAPLGEHPAIQWKLRNVRNQADKG